MKPYFFNPLTLAGFAAIVLAVPFSSIILGLVGTVCVLIGLSAQALKMQRGANPQVAVHLGDLSPQSRSQLKPIRDYSRQILQLLEDPDAGAAIKALSSEVKSEVEVVERYGYTLASNRTSLERVLRDTRQIASAGEAGAVGEAAEGALHQAESRLADIDRRMEEARSILADLALRINTMKVNEVAGPQFADETLSMVGRLRALNATIDEADTMMRVDQP